MDVLICTEVRLRARCQTWNAVDGWQLAPPSELFRSHLIIAFGAGHVLSNTNALKQLCAIHPSAIVASVSTAGEIANELVLDDSIAALHMQFEHTLVKAYKVSMQEGESSASVTGRLADLIDQVNLTHVLVFSDGTCVNGTALTNGLAERLPSRVAVTGGLAGDGDRFQQTFVGLGEISAPRQIIAIGFYGSRLRIGFGSVGGWTGFGPERVVTASTDNVLHQLDGEPALALYKRYLGEASNELPASALRFPLALLSDSGDKPLVRTILSVDEAAETMTFACDVPQGSRVRLMRASFDALVDGAEHAATDAHVSLGRDASAAILVSCVGRRLILKQQVEDEIDGVRRILGDTPVFAGFYSYGEITPLLTGGRCELHNQTMTITTFAEC